MQIIPLNQLKKGFKAMIHDIAPNTSFGSLDESVGQRLADLGFSKGMTLELIAVGSFGKGPYAVRLGNQSQFSLRDAEAQKILCLPAHKD